jgi:hypothetical protein
MTKSPIAIGLGSGPALKLGSQIFQASRRAAAACGEFAPIAAKRDAGLLAMPPRYGRETAAELSQC